MNDIEFLSALHFKAVTASEKQWVWLLIADANRLQELCGEGHYTHNQRKHGFLREQLLEKINNHTLCKSMRVAAALNR